MYIIYTLEQQNTIPSFSSFFRNGYILPKAATSEQILQRKVCHIINFKLQNNNYAS